MAFLFIYMVDVYVTFIKIVKYVCNLGHSNKYLLEALHVLNLNCIFIQFWYQNGSMRL